MLNIVFQRVNLCITSEYEMFISIDFQLSQCRKQVTFIIFATKVTLLQRDGDRRFIVAIDDSRHQTFTA